MYQVEIEESIDYPVVAKKGVEYSTPFINYY